MLLWTSLWVLWLKWLKLGCIFLISWFYVLIFIDSWFLATVARWLVPSDVIVFGCRDQLFRNQRIEFVSNAKFQRNSTLGTDISHPWQRLLGDVSWFPAGEILLTPAGNGRISPRGAKKAIYTNGILLNRRCGRHVRVCEKLITHLIILDWSYRDTGVQLTAHGLPTFLFLGSKITDV